MQQGTEDFSSIDIELAKLYKNGRISLEDGMVFANDKFHYKELAETGKTSGTTGR